MSESIVVSESNEVSETLPECCDAMGLNLKIMSAKNVGESSDREDWPNAHVATNVEIKLNDRLIWSGPFKQGIGCIKGNPKFDFPSAWEKPDVASVLSCLLSDSDCYFNHSDFTEWADDTGYDSDSIKASKIYDACIKTGRTLARSFTPTQLERLRNAAQDY